MKKIILVTFIMSLFVSLASESDADSGACQESCHLGHSLGRLF